MAVLLPGVLLRLMEEMDSNEQEIGDEHKPALLQVISIIPVMAEGDLWPKQGFYLKVSDSSHAMYVSLPYEYDELILNDKLHLGQFIYVTKLETATPVPILRGVNPVHGRHPFVGTPKDIVPASLGFLGPSLSDSDSKTEKSTSNDAVKRPSEKRRSLNASKSHRIVEPGIRKVTRSRSIPVLSHLCLPTKNDVEKKHLDVINEISKISINTCIDKENDSESTKSSNSPRPKSKRKNWERITAGLEETLRSRAVKHQTKPLARTHSASISPHAAARYDSSDGNSSCTSTRKRNTHQGSKVARSSIRQRISESNEKRVRSSIPASPSSSAGSGRKWRETRVSWDSIPSSLVKIGKEVLRQRDVALLAAVEALQEASAAERLTQCLSMYAELQLSDENDPQQMVDRLLDLHDDLTSARLIAQSLAKISSLRTSDTESINSGSIKAAVKLALERKNHAASWIKAAVASDLSPFSGPIKPITHSVDSPKTSKKSSSRNRSKPKGACTVTKHGDILVGLASVKDSSTDWVKGTSLYAAADLANTLEDECRKSFLIHVEKFLDEVMSKTASTESDYQIAGVMYQIKRVNDWLDIIHSKDGNNMQNDGYSERSMSDNEEIEACQRVRNKIYTVLLKHVERSAVALGKYEHNVSTLRI